jgi:PhoPQ-activated pathogenicity-related protein
VRVLLAQGDTLGRLEDQIIARTWRLFIEQIVDDPDVNLLLPMVKASHTQTQYQGNANTTTKTLYNKGNDQRTT